MKPTDDLNQMLFLYAEALDGADDALTGDELEAVRARIEASPELQRELKAIRLMRRGIRQASGPAVPIDLAGACLHPETKQTGPSGALAWRGLALAACCALIFAAGLWMGRQADEASQATLAALFERQAALTVRLEQGLADQYQLSSDDRANPWSGPLMKLRASTVQLAAVYEQRPNDPVIERGLALAVSQNIAMLQALNDYLNANQELSEFDFTAVSSDAPGQGAI